MASARTSHLTNPEAWRVIFERAYDEILRTSVREWVNPVSIGKIIDACLEPSFIRGWTAPLLRDGVRRVVERLRTDNVPTGTYVPEDARRAASEILKRSDLIPEDFLHRLAMQPAVDRLLAETIYSALKEFNAQVNPFFAEWGLPALIKRVVPIGAGAILKSFDLVRAEFEKRLDPEIRKFLPLFIGRAKPALVNEFAARQGDPEFVRLREAGAHYVYEASLQKLIRAVDERFLDAGARATEATITNSEVRIQVRKHAEAMTAAFLAEHGTRTVGDYLKHIGVQTRPDFASVAEVAARCWGVLAATGALDEAFSPSPPAPVPQNGGQGS